MNIIKKIFGNIFKLKTLYTILWLSSWIAVLWSNSHWKEAISLSITASAFIIWACFIENKNNKW